MAWLRLRSWLPAALLLSLSSTLDVQESTTRRKYNPDWQGTSVADYKDWIGKQGTQLYEFTDDWDTCNAVLVPGSPMNRSGNYGYRDCTNDRPAALKCPVSKPGAGGALDMMGVEGCIALPASHADFYMIPRPQNDALKIRISSPSRLATYCRPTINHLKGFGPDELAQAVTTKEAIACAFSGKQTATLAIHNKFLFEHDVTCHKQKLTECTGGKRICAVWTKWRFMKMELKKYGAPPHFTNETQTGGCRRRVNMVRGKRLQILTTAQNSSWISSTEIAKSGQIVAENMIKQLPGLQEQKCKRNIQNPYISKSESQPLVMEQKYVDHYVANVWPQIVKYEKVYGLCSTHALLY